MFIRMTIFTWFISIMLLVSCGHNFVSPGNLDEARSRWRAHNIENYNIQQQMNCFCVFAGEPYQVTVVNNEIVEVTNKATGTPIDSSFIELFMTIPELFDLVESINPKEVAYFKVEYDATFGYPSLISVDYSARVADDEITWITGELEKLNNNLLLKTNP